MTLLCWFRCSVVSDCLATSWVYVACQASLSVGFSRQEYWSGLPFLSPGDLPDPRIKFMSPALAGRFFALEPPGKPEPFCKYQYMKMILHCRNTEKAMSAAGKTACPASETYKGFLSGTLKKLMKINRKKSGNCLEYRQREWISNSQKWKAEELPRI